MVTIRLTLLAGVGLSATSSSVVSAFTPPSLNYWGAATATATTTAVARNRFQFQTSLHAEVEPTAESASSEEEQQQQEEETTTTTTDTNTASDDDNDDNNNNDHPTLILDGFDKEMHKFRSKYPTAEADFLTAARKRAEMAVESNNASGSDDDWQTIAQAKQEELGNIDDWEKSLEEAGNADSQILIPIDFRSEDDDDDDDDANRPEPKLLLF